VQSFLLQQQQQQQTHVPHPDPKMTSPKNQDLRWVQAVSAEVCGEQEEFLPHFLVVFKLLVCLFVCLLF
jgi:hypothetical protein